jgi:nicotinamidase-related amidase
MGTTVERRGNSKCHADASQLVVIDIQQRLGDAMPNKVLNRVLQNTVLLLRTSELLGIPVVHTEQYPEGLGPTNPSVAGALPAATRSFRKTTFSCCETPDLRDAFLADPARTQLVLIGMEAHICVLQTALDLAAADRSVFVVEDAICSRRLENYQNALDRLRDHGVGVISAESVVFEWLRDSKHPHFKSIQALLR